MVGVFKAGRSLQVSEPMSVIGCLTSTSSPVSSKSINCFAGTSAPLTPGIDEREFRDACHFWQANFIKKPSDSEPPQPVLLV